MAMVGALITADDYFDAAAGVREPTQLIDGVIVPSQPKQRHQETTLRIWRRLQDWIEGPGFGLAGIPIDMIIDQYNVWLVDTTGRVVTALRRSEAGARTFDVEQKVTVDEALTTPLLPGFALSLAEVLAD